MIADSLSKKASHEYINSKRRQVIE